MSKRPIAGHWGPHVTDEFTFSTGKTVGIRRVSPLLAYALRRQFPPPKPPMQEVEHAAGGGRQEPNPSHPDHLEALAAHQELVNHKTQDLMIEGGVEVEVDQEALAQARALMEMSGAVLPTEISEKVAYIKYCLVGSAEDIAGIIRAVQGISQPTEEAVANHTATFPGDA